MPSLGLDARKGLPFLARLAWTRGTCMVYHPRRYDEIPEYQDWMSQLERFEFDPGFGRQTCFYRPASTPGTPSRTWILFGGNSTLALDWLPTISCADSTREAFLLFDYPGYGLNPGSPSPGSVKRSLATALDRLCSQQGLDPGEIPRRLSVMGHSLGAAFAMQTAVRFQLEEAVLLCPFTSLHEMAVRVAGPILAPLLPHKLDNVGAIRTWSDQQSPSGTGLEILHPVRDEIVPVSMARKIRELFPETVTLWEIKNCGHSDMVFFLRDAIAARLNASRFEFSGNWARRI